MVGARRSLALTLVIGAAILTVMLARLIGARFGESADESAAWSVNITRSSDASRPEVPPALAAAEPNSMQTFLLGSTEDSRAQVFRLAILDAGFVCPAINTARLVGSDGSSWRATCGAGNAYWIDVEESGRLKPAPVMHADSGEFGSPVVPAAPPTQIPGTDRTLRLEFERDQRNNQ
jgi:hypothetical protein